MQVAKDAVHTDSVEICAVVEGVLGVSLDGVAQRQVVGDVAIIPAGVPHAAWTEEASAAEVVIHVDASGLTGLRAGVWHAPGLVELLARARSPSDVAAAAEAALRLCGSGQLTPSVDDARIARVVTAVRGDLAGAWSLGRMASVAGMSVSAFRRTFAATLGASPTRWVLDQRVAAAAGLLRETDRSVADIALSLGFGSGSRLTEAFARRQGCAPSVWRDASRPRAQR
jgi:AraC-like DNA-binding protein